MEIVRNRLDVKELNSGKIYTFYYRTPDIEEWLDYSDKIRKALKFEENASVKEIVKIKLEGVELALTGIGEKQFEIEIDGIETFLSPDIEDWKAILKRRFYYLLIPVFDDAFYRRGEIEVEKK